jgi:hypothetical protein|tara:strand:- start:182 stop:382 length:201 start_codon:yes stop_codon:yes gene_type:complete
MLLNIKYLRGIFKKHKVQLPKETMEAINRLLEVELNKLAEACVNGNIKRLDINLFSFIRNRFKILK